MRRVDDLAFLVRHGVMGDSPSAKWVGVDCYLREHTSSDATVLAISTSIYQWRPRGVYYDASLRTRTGRTMPLGPAWSVLFQLPRLQQLDRDAEQMQRLLAAWQRRDVASVRDQLAYFQSVGYPLNYLVVENGEAAWLNGTMDEYRIESVIGAFTILRKDRDSTFARRPRA